MEITAMDVLFPMTAFAFLTALIARRWRSRRLGVWFLLGLLFGPAGPISALARTCPRCHLWANVWQSQCSRCGAWLKVENHSGESAPTKWAKAWAASFAYVSLIIITMIWIYMPEIDRRDITLLKVAFLICTAPALLVPESTSEFLKYAMVFFVSPFFWGVSGYVNGYIFRRTLGDIN
jgi:hypothetical protein